MSDEKKYGYSSVDNMTGEKFNTNMFFNFKDTTKSKNKSLFGGLKELDPYLNVGGGKLRPDIRKGYLGIKFTKEFKKR